MVCGCLCALPDDYIDPAIPLTDDVFVHQITQRGDAWCYPLVAVGAGSSVALGLQVTSLGLIGQALKTVDTQSGAVIQVKLPVAKYCRSMSLTFAISGLLLGLCL